MFSQDAMDLISGHYSVNRNNPSPFQLNGFESLSVSNMSVFIADIRYFCYLLLSTIKKSGNQLKLQLIEKSCHFRILVIVLVILHKVILVQRIFSFDPIIRMYWLVWLSMIILSDSDEIALLDHLQQLSIWLFIWECGEPKCKNDVPIALYFTLHIAKYLQ
jgi:hypothetical protein